MGFSASDALEFVKENDVKFIRLSFCDLFGVPKNFAIMAGRLADAFENGVCVDTAAVPGFVNGEDADIFLFPDPSTLSVLPWRPSHGGVVRMFCDIRRADGRPYAGDGRRLLRDAVGRAAEMGLTCKIGCEYEFYLFQLDEQGQPTRIPHDRAGYCDMAPLDKGENVRREICLALEDMGILPESSHHERGPGQNEIACRYNGALEAADALVSFKWVTEIIAARNGLNACFTPKPLDNNDGSALHTNLSLSRGGVNLFQTEEGRHCAEAESFMAGILHHLPDLTLFLNPVSESYRRLGSDVPLELTWSHQNRDQLVRVPAASGESGRMELRSPDPMLSPYLAFALLLEAGLWGIEQNLPLKPMAEGVHLPDSLEAALERAMASDLVSGVVPAKALERYFAQKRLECRGQ